MVKPNKKKRSQSLPQRCGVNISLSQVDGSTFSRSGQKLVLGCVASHQLWITWITLFPSLKNKPPLSYLNPWAPMLMKANFRPGLSTIAILIHLSVPWPSLRLLISLLTRRLEIINVRVGVQKIRDLRHLMCRQCDASKIWVVHFNTHKLEFRKPEAFVFRPGKLFSLICQQLDESFIEY